MIQSPLITSHARPGPGGPRRALRCWLRATRCASLCIVRHVASRRARVRPQLPPRLVVADVPGMPTAGVRSTLRDRFGVEAALGNFGERGNFIRLSHAVYNAPADFERLRDAVLELVEEQERQ